MDHKLACWIFFAVGFIVSWLVRNVVEEKKKKKLDAWHKKMRELSKYD